LMRPFSTQVRRITKSAILYAAIIFSLFRGFDVTTRLLVPNLAPLNFSFKYAASEVPLDLVTQVFVKVIVSVCSPRLLSGLLPWYLRGVARALSLRSFLFGGRYLGEEGSVVARWGSFRHVPDRDRLYLEARLRQMAERPVSAEDIRRIPIIDDGGVATDAAPATDEGLPVGVVGQPPDANDGPRPGRESTRSGSTIVHVPGLFGVRIFLFCVCVWVALVASGLLFFAVPILLGRRLLAAMGYPGTMHEMYTFCVGFLVLGLLFRLVHHVISRVLDLGPRALLLDLLVLPPRLCNGLAIFVVVGCVWPLLIGFYLWMVVSPLLLSPAMVSPLIASSALDISEGGIENYLVGGTLVTPILSCWMTGMMILKIAYSLTRLICTPRRAEILERLGTLHGWASLDGPWLKDVYLHLLLPYTFRLVTMNVLPPATVLLVCPMLGLPYDQILMLQRWSFALGLLVPLATVELALVYGLQRRFVQGIRDDAYLVGRRLHNFERPA